MAIIDGRKISVAPHNREKPYAKEKAITNANLLGYVRTRRCQEQEAALNRMALQLNHVIESDRLDGWPDEQANRVRESM